MVEADAITYISTRIENYGFADAPATTVRLYQSDQSADAAIAASDTVLWMAAVPALRAGETWIGNVPDYYTVEEEEYWQERVEKGDVVWNAAVMAPSAPGRVFYWLCVDPVPGEDVNMGGQPNCDVDGGKLGSPRTPSFYSEYWDPSGDGAHTLILITDGDPSWYTDLAWVGENRISVTHSEQSERTVYVYEARYADQQTISVMVDQGFSRSRADELATFYARRVGQLPERSALDEFVVLFSHDGPGPTYASRGQNRVTHSHYEWPPRCAWVFLLHEYAHLAYDSAAYASARWRSAVASDGRFITSYAHNFPDREDVAESYVAWFAVRCSADRLLPPDEGAFVRSMIPARLAYFDDLLGGTRSCPRR